MLVNYSDLIVKLFNNQDVDFPSIVASTLNKVLCDTSVEFTEQELNILRLYLLNNSTYYANTCSGSGNINNVYRNEIDKIVNDKLYLT